MGSNLIKDKIRAELQKLSKDDLINIVAELTNLYVVSRLNNRIANISCVQQCVNQVQSNIQPAINGMLQELNIDFRPVKSTDDTDGTDSVISVESA